VALLKFLTGDDGQLRLNVNLTFTGRKLDTFQPGKVEFLISSSSRVLTLPLHWNYF